ncbi:MAG: GYD domain-containing protein, partial [Nitrososphaeraceae archaeon]
LWNWTDQGLRAIKNSPTRLASFKTKPEKAGGKLIVEYYTMGQYDGIVIVEAPTDDTIMSIMLSAASKGNFRSTSLRAFPVSEASEIIEKISPSGSDKV